MRVIFCASIKLRIPHKRKPSEEGLCCNCGFSTGLPRPHRARRTWSKPGCCQSGCLTISHNRLSSVKVATLTIPPPRRLTMLMRLCAPFIDRSHAASICASLRGCWIYRYQPRFTALPITGRLFRLPRLDHLLSALVGGMVVAAA